jgi:hypothetical protein
LYNKQNSFIVGEVSQTNGPYGNYFGDSINYCGSGSNVLGHYGYAATSSTALGIGARVTGSRSVGIGPYCVNNDTDTAKFTDGMKVVMSSASIVDIDVSGQTKIRMPYGHFYSTTTQNISVINTTQTITLDGAFDAHNIEISANNCITVLRSGEYDITLLAQCDGDVTKILYIFARLNNVNIPFTTVQRKFSANQSPMPIPMFLNLDMNAGDCLDFIMVSDSTNSRVVSMAESSSPAMPASASITVIIDKTGEIQ